MRRRSEKYGAEGSKYVQRIGLYLYKLPFELGIGPIRSW